MTNGTQPQGPVERFDLVVIGAGSGNTIVDDSFADARVAIIDHDRFGGTCLNAGCIPTKMLLHPADVALKAATLPQLGFDAHVGRVRWAQLRDRVFSRVDLLAREGAAHRRQQDNITVFDDTATFVGERRLRVGGHLIEGDTVVVAAGSRPRKPDLAGLDNAASRLYTSASVMRMDSLPESMIIVGGGAVACEYAHLFATFGVKVSIVTMTPRLLADGDRDVSATLARQLGKRVTIGLRQEVTSVALTAERVLVFASDENDVEYEYDAEALLLAAGRTPNTDLLDVAAAGIEVDEVGRIVVDDHLRTSADGVFALGDITQRGGLKHVANHHARVIKHNLHHPDDLQAVADGPPPQAVFTAPEVASAGLTEESARDWGIDVVVGMRRFSDVAYGWAMQSEPEDGFAKVLVCPQTRRVVGAHIVGPQASLLIQPMIQAIALESDAWDVARGQMWIHPALPEVVENALLDALGKARCEHDTAEEPCY